MRSTETRFARSITEAADEANIPLTTEDATTLRAELWNDYPDNCFLPREDIERHGLLAGAHHLYPEYRHR